MDGPDRRIPWWHFRWTAKFCEKMIPNNNSNEKPRQNCDEYCHILCNNKFHYSLLSLFTTATHESWLIFHIEKFHIPDSMKTHTKRQIDAGSRCSAAFRDFDFYQFPKSRILHQGHCNDKRLRYFSLCIVHKPKHKIVLHEYWILLLFGTNTHTHECFNWMTHRQPMFFSVWKISCFHRSTKIIWRNNSTNTIYEKSDPIKIIRINIAKQIINRSISNESEKWHHIVFDVCPASAIRMNFWIQFGKMVLTLLRHGLKLHYLHEPYWATSFLLWIFHSFNQKRIANWARE